MVEKRSKKYNNKKRAKANFVQERHAGNKNKCIALENKTSDVVAKVT